MDKSQKARKLHRSSRIQRKVIIPSILGMFFLLGGSFWLLASSHVQSHQSLLARVVKNAKLTDVSISTNTQTTNSSDASLSSSIQLPKNYQSTKGLSISYPDGWFTPEDLGSTNAQESESFLTNEKVKLPALLSSNGIMVFFNKLSYDPVKDTGGREYLVLNNPKGEIISGQYDNRYDILTRLDDVTIAGQNAIHFTEDFSADPTLKPNLQDAYLFQKNSHYYEIEFMTTKSAAVSFAPTISSMLNSLIVTN